MFSSTVQRLLFGLLSIVCIVFLLGSATAPQPAVLFIPDVETEQETAMLLEESETAPEEEPTVCAEPEEPAPSELRYAHLALSITQEEKALMALTVYHESRGEPRDGQRAVAETILNRVLSDRFSEVTTVKEVIYQKNQFDCAAALTTQPIREPACLTNCFEVVNEVIMGAEYVIPDHYLFFSTHCPSTDDYIKIGHHYFR